MTIIKRRTVHVKANSDPRQTTYLVKRCADGKAFCSCPGFMYRQTCKHVIKALNYK